MNRCEDYPCCGHEDGGCPDKDGCYSCCDCGCKLPKDATSAMCASCRKDMYASFDRDDAYYDSGDGW